MKTSVKYLTAIILIIISPGLSVAQEYDDLYFTPKDRKVKKQADLKTPDNFVLENVETNFTETSPEVSYSQKNINPEYVARYTAEQYESESDFDRATYYDEDFANGDNQPPVVNNYNYYYGNQSFNPYNDPFFNNRFAFGNRWAPYDPFYDPWLARPGWSVNVGYGWGWNAPRWRRGWRVGVSYGWGGGWYDPWYCPGRYAYGYNPWRNNVVVINNYESRSRRAYSRGIGPSRSTSGVRNSRSVPSRSRSAANVSDSRSRSTGRVATGSRSSGRTATGRTDYSRSRSTSENSRSSVTSPSRLSVGDDNNSRSGSRSDYSRSSDRSRSTVTPNHTPRSSGSRQRSGNYSPGSRSGSGSYSNSRSRSSSGSRSGSSGSRSGSSRSRRGN